LGVALSVGLAVREPLNQEALAGRLVEQEEERGTRLDEDLGVVLLVLELVGAGEQGFFELFGALDGCAQGGSAEGVEGAAGGVHDDEALVGEELRHEPGEGAAESGAGSVEGAKLIADRSVAEKLAGAVERGLDARAEDDAADGDRDRGAEAGGEGFDRCFGEEVKLIDLGEVVVFGGEPEDGDVVDAGCGGGVRGAGDCGRGLEQSKERAAEEADLLAGDDGAGSMAQLLHVGEGLRTGPVFEAFGVKGSGETFGIGGWTDGVMHPGSAEGLGAVPAAHGRAFRHGEIVAIERGDVRQDRDGITLSAHGASGLALGSASWGRTISCLCSTLRRQIPGCSRQAIGCERTDCRCEAF
jgi:hypothetical protein